MTIGEDRVRISFNPSANAQVEDIKRRIADAIDWCHSRMQSDLEVVRCLSLAMTHFEDGAMWAVKAVTTPSANSAGAPTPNAETKSLASEVGASIPR